MALLSRVMCLNQLINGDGRYFSVLSPAGRTSMLAMPNFTVRGELTVSPSLGCVMNTLALLGAVDISDGLSVCKLGCSALTADVLSPGFVDVSVDWLK